MTSTDQMEDAPLDPDDELLVAYLDGELGRESRAEVENRLVDNESLRERLSELQSGWELLDVLPTPHLEQSLVESTLELAITEVTGQGSAPQAKGRSKWFRSVALSALVCVGTITAAYVASAVVQRRQLQRDLQDLAVVEDLDAYKIADDLELMRTLAANPKWTQLESAARELQQAQSRHVSLRKTHPAERIQAIEQLPIERRLQIQSRWEQFQRFKPEDRRKIRQVADRVSSDADPESLLATMRTYVRWRLLLSDELIEAVESTDPATREAGIREAIEASKEKLAEQSGAILDQETVDRIYFALEQLARERIRQSPRFRGKQIDGARMWGVICFHFSSNDKLRRIAEMAGVSPRVKPSTLSLRDLETLRLWLPDESLEQLDTITDGDQLFEDLLVQHWVEETIRRKSPFQNDQTMLQKYQTLRGNEREAIDLLPPDQFLRRLDEDREKL